MSEKINIDVVKYRLRKKPPRKNDKNKTRNFVIVLAFLISIPIFILLSRNITDYIYHSEERILSENKVVLTKLINVISSIHKKLLYKKQGRYSLNVIEFNYYSDLLKDYISINVYLPPGYILNQNIKKYPVIYFLHGAFDGEKDHWFTVDRNEYKSAHAELSANRMIMNNEIREVILVALDEPGGFFTPVRKGKKGRNFERAFVYEIIPYLESTFSSSGERAITGLSSGGYYALYFAIKYPQLFKHAGATSGSFFLGVPSVSILEMMKKNMDSVKSLKSIYFDMGNNDPGNSHDNIVIYNYLIKHGIRTRLDFVQGGHSFQVWRGHPERFMKFCFSAKPYIIPASNRIN